GVDAVDPDGVAPAPLHLEIMVAVREVQHPALAQHDVEVELTAQSLVELQGVVVEGGARRIKVVRAHDLRITAGVTAADPAALEPRGTTDSVLFRKVVGGREPVSPAADDDDLVAVFRLRIAPGALPVA